MKIKLFSIYSKLISLCLILLGFNSCSDDDNGGGDPVVEYGVPSAKYKVKGQVVSSEETKKPIKNIRIVMIEDLEEGREYYNEGDTTFTDAEGRFEINRHNYPYYKYLIKLEDVDGDENGSFENNTQKIEFKSSDFKDGGSWYKGQAEKDMKTIEMTPKQKNE